MRCSGRRVDRDHCGTIVRKSREDLRRRRTLGEIKDSIEVL